MTLSRNLRKRIEWQRCREQVLGPCADETDRCCAIVPCKLCLFLEEYGADDLFATAEFDGEFYSGTIDGLSFVGFWERRGETCVFVVEIDDVEVFAGQLCEGYDVLTCRDPGGEVVLGDGRTLSWETVEPLELPHHKIGIESCRTEVVFIVDISPSNVDGLFDFKEAATTIVEKIKSVGDTYRLGLITFAEPTDSPVEQVSMSQNNETEWLAAVAALTIEEPDLQPISIPYERKSHTALQMAAGLGWLDRNQSYAVLISQGYPQDALDSPLPLSEEQIAAAVSLAGKNVTLHAVSLTDADGVFIPSYVLLNQATAEAGGGSAFQVTADGSDDANGGDNQFLTLFDSAFESRCEIDRPTCKEPFCGTCTCFPRKLCVTVLEIQDTYSISDPCSEKLEVDAEDTCDNPTWTFETSCASGGLTEYTLTLYADEYTNECMLELSGGGETLTQTISTCSGVNVTFTTATQDIEIQVVTADCGCTPDPPLGSQCCDFDALNPAPTSVDVSLCGCSINLTPDEVLTYSGSELCNGVRIDGTFKCIDGDGPNANRYQLSLNCNATGPFPVFAIGDSVSCDPFVVTFEMSFNCQGLCDGETQPITVIVTAGS